MAPKLYSLPASPPARSVLILAKALDIELEVIEVDLIGGENLSDEFVKRSINFGNVTKLPQDSIDSLKEVYAILDKFLADNDWVAGDTFTIADIALGTSTTSWDVMVSYEEFPKIKAWVERLEKLPFFKEGNQPGLDDYRRLIKSKLIQ